MPDAARLERSTQNVSSAKTADAEPDTFTDEQWSTWMTAAQAGDKTAYEKLLRDCIPFIRRVARQQRVHPNAIDDVIQETLLSIHDARATYDPRRSFMAWLRTIAQRRAIDRIRRTRRTIAREVHSPDAYENHATQPSNPESTATDRDRISLLTSAILELPVSQRYAIEALVLRGYSFSAAALAGRTSEGALRVSWHRALKSLKAQITRKELDDGSK